MQLPFEKEQIKILDRNKTIKSLDKPLQEFISKSAEKKDNDANRSIQELLRMGIVVIDKPAGPSSHNVSHYVKEILKLSKAGHPGTLDPAVTGVLPVALENATKINQVLLSAGKEYVCVMHMHKDIDDKIELIREELNSFVGKIKQTPPVKSAVKREEREREIYYLEILEIKGRDILFVVGCQAGTYIRKLCADFGEKTGLGAHMKELRRTKAGPFNESHLITLNDLRKYFDCYINLRETESVKKEAETILKQKILPVEKAVEHLPKVWILERSIKFIRNGRNVRCDDIVRLTDNIKKEKLVAVMNLNNELIAFGPAYLNSKEILEKDAIAINTDRVI